MWVIGCVSAYLYDLCIKRKISYWGFPTSMVYLYYIISCLRYTILVGNHQYVGDWVCVGLPLWPLYKDKPHMWVIGCVSGDEAAPCLTAHQTGRSTARKTRTHRRRGPPANWPLWPGPLSWCPLPRPTESRRTRTRWVWVRHHLSLGLGREEG